MKKSTAIWRMVSGNQPLITAGGTPARPILQSVLPDVLCGGRADFFVAGHDENLQHLMVPMVDAGCGVDEFVAGGGSTQPKEVDARTPGLKFARQTQGVLAIQLTAKQAEFSFYDAADAHLLYHYSKER